MRRALLAALTTSALTLTAVAAAIPAQAAPAPTSGGPISPAAYGMHVPGISQGVDPTITYGAVRLWDSGVAWGQVEQSKGNYWWTGLDLAIGNANTQQAAVTYVLGSTPTWAASDKKQGTYPYKGAASMPKSMKDWKSWVTAVTQRYADSIDSYQIWNEANLTTFWMGTPKQMAQLTQAAAQIIRKNDPTAKIVSASSTVRLQSAYKKFFPKYLKELKKVGWPIDAVSVHLYPPSTGTPGDRAAYAEQVKADMKKAKVPASKELWDTEINYGIAGPGSKYPDKNINDPQQAAAWVAQTYLDNLRLGINRAYWYLWAPNVPLVGIQMSPGTPGSTAYQAVENWTVGKFFNCSTGTVNVCQFGNAAEPQSVAWASSGSGTFTVPPNVTRVCDALNACLPATPGTQVTIGSMPQWFGTATAF